MIKRFLLVALLVAAVGCGGGDGPEAGVSAVDSTATSGSGIGVSTTLPPSGAVASPTLPAGSAISPTPTSTPPPVESSASTVVGAAPSSAVPGSPAVGGSGRRPNCATGCNLVMEGDSITQGLLGFLWNKFCTDTRQTVCVNSGLSGNRIDQMIETARVDVDNVVGTGTNDVLIFWGGTNDMWQKFYSPDPIANTDAAYAATARYINERRAAGWDYILILTHPPMNPGLIAGTDHLNDLIRKNSAGADVVIDIAADPRLANPFDPVMRADDGVHYRDGGALLTVDDYLIPAVLALKG